MARLPRIDIPGWPMHVVVRGNNRQQVFRTDGDRIFFHRCLVEVTRRHGARVHAYVLMDNHFHLLVTGDASGAIGAVIQSMGRRYVSYFNYLHERTGTLWEGRYRSSLVETDRYFLSCSRYIEMNPVRAGMVVDPHAHPWSSYRANAHGMPDDLVSPHALYLGLGAGETHRLEAYRRLFLSAEGDGDAAAIREALAHGSVLGTPEFRGRVEQILGRPLAGDQPGPRRRAN